MQPIIEVNGLAKKYQVGEIQPYYTFRDSLMNLVKNPFQTVKESLNKDEFWALKNINFSVNQGEVVGIIGRNGAGKSTLLKILSQITPPTEGEVMLRGRVGSLLEVGTGFSPELTGRENIFLNGAILGMKRQEVKSRFDEIVAFSEVEKFLDTPLKHYSSGMYMRLAFAVAAYLEPEILIVDEVLAVGDAEFQKKCLGKMSNVAKQGRTVLFVSHNMTAIRSLCERAILLDHGHVVTQGLANDVIDQYSEANQDLTSRIWDNQETAPGNQDVKIHSAKVIANDKDTSNIFVSTPITLDFEFWNLANKAQLNLSLILATLDGQIVFNSVSETVQLTEGLIKGRCQIPANLLNDEKYRVTIMVVRGRAQPIFILEDALFFEVKDVEREAGWQGKWVGAVRPKLDWSLKQLGK